MMLIIYLETANKNLLFGFMPEKIGLLVFGIILIILAVGIRRFLVEKKNKN